MIYKDNYVRTGRAVVLWDGVTSPEKKEDGSVVHSLKVAIAPGSAELQELEQIAQKSLKESKRFNGQLPAGGGWPTSVATPDPTLPNHTVFSAKTYNGAPDVYNAEGQRLDPMQYNAMIYAGAIVEVLVHAFDYDSKGNKGISFGLDGLMIVDATTPRLSIAGVDTSGAFGAPHPSGQGSTAAPPVAAPPASTPPPAASPPPPVEPAPDFVQGPPSPQITALAVQKGYTYEALKAAGWNDDQMRQHGYIV
jgi:hypothetical protein